MWPSGESDPGRETSKYKGPEVEIGFARLAHSKEVDKVGWN